jgi:putative transcriptional regulator
MNRTRRPSKSRKTEVGQRVIEALEEAVAYARGEDVPGMRVTTIHVPDINVRKLRRSMKLSQGQFAAKFGFSPDSVQNWEQRRRVPDGPAKILLAVVANHPDAVADTIRGMLKRIK